MAGQRTNEWKLGLFVVTCLGVGFGGLLWLGANKGGRDIIEAWTYLDESVQGLEQGSAVKFRGVTIGTVARISIAPDRRRVAVLMHIYEDLLASLGLRKRGQVEDPSTPFVPAGVRVQLASAGITGGKFLSIDLFDPAQHPLPELPFVVPWNYVPSVPSTLKSLEETVTYVASQLPTITDQTRGLLTEARDFMRELDARALSTNAQQVMKEARDGIDALDLPDLRKRADTLLAQVERLVTRLETLTTDVSALTGDGGEVKGLIADLRATSQAITDAVQRADVAATSSSLRETSGSITVLSRDLSGMSDELRQALVSLRDAADKVANLADVLERDPGSLIHGRSPGGVSPGGRR